MSRPSLLLLMGLGVLGACRDEAAQTGPVDAGPRSLLIDRPSVGVRFKLPLPWEAVEPPPSTGKVETLALARRPAQGTRPPFRVAPRVELTLEPAGEGPPEAVFARVLADLKRIEEREGVSLERAGFSARTLAGNEVAEIRLRYRVAATRVVHRSLLILRADGRDLAALTSTYLKDDEERVELELDRMYERLELFEPREEPPRE